MADTELLPCPFCGGAARIQSNRDWHRLYADHDDECVFDADDHVLMYPAQPGYLIQIAEDWNRRAALASRPAEVDDSLTDAKRLDWLQSTNQTFCGNYSNTGFRAIGSSVWHGTLREAIDGAMIEAAPSHTTNKEKGGANGHVLDR